MKKRLRHALFIGLCMFLLPIIIIWHEGYLDKPYVKEVLEQQKKDKEARQADIMDQEVLIGILAREIPYTYEQEALKAQAVVIRTYMARRILGMQNKGLINGYSSEEQKALWGERYDEIHHIYEEAVAATAYMMIFYNNQPIEALYHRASAGETRDASSIYTSHIPYLKGVESSVDTIATQVKLNKREVIEKLRFNYEELVIDEGTLAEQIQIVEIDKAGYVKYIQIGNVTMRGEDFIGILELPSSCFEIYAEQEALIFDVKGIGHGIGMSQNGANELARQGMTYEAILKEYYSDIVVEKYEV